MVVMVAETWLVGYLKNFIVLQIRLASYGIKTTFPDIEEVLTGVYKNMSFKLKSTWGTGKKSFRKADGVQAFKKLI